MSALNFLFGSTGNSALDSAAVKLRESQSTTTKTNPYISETSAKGIAVDALSSAEAYKVKAEEAAGKANATQQQVTAAVQEGKAANISSKTEALKLAQFNYEQQLKQASMNTEEIQQYRETYGSNTHKKTMKALYEQQQANAQELIAAQSQQDQGGAWNWITSQFKAELAAEESRLTDATINQLKSNEMQAAQKLAMDLQLNQEEAAGFKAEEVARSNMLKNQADTIVSSAMKGLGFDREQFSADMQVLNMNAEVVGAAMKRLDVLTRTNDLTTSAIQAEQQRILKETAELNLSEAKKRVQKSEVLEAATEQDFQDYQIRLEIPEADRRTWTQMVKEQEDTKVMNPILQSFMVSRNSLTGSDEKLATGTVAAYQSGVVTPEVAQQLKTMESIQKKQELAFQNEWLTANGFTASDLNKPSVMEKYAAAAEKLALRNKDGSFKQSRLAELDRSMKEAVEFGNSNIDSATADALADLSTVTASMKASNMEAKLLSAGADPEIAKLISDKIANKIPLDIQSGAPARQEITSNIDSFLNTLGDDVIMSPEGIRIANAAAKYQAKVYQLHRTAPSTKSYFPNWRQSIIPGNPLRGESSINLEDAGSLSLLYREAIIKRRAKLTDFNNLSNKFLTERY